MPSSLEYTRRNFLRDCLTYGLPTAAALVTGCRAGRQPPPTPDSASPTPTLRPSEQSYNEYTDLAQRQFISLPGGETMSYLRVSYEEFAALVKRLYGGRLASVSAPPPSINLPKEFQAVPTTEREAVDRLNAIIDSFGSNYETVEGITGGNHTVTIYKPTNLAIDVFPQTITAYLDWIATTQMMTGKRATGSTFQNLIFTNYSLNPLVPQYPNSVTEQYVDTKGFVSSVSCVNLQGSFEQRYGPDAGLAIELVQALFYPDLDGRDKEQVSNSLVLAYQQARAAWMRP